MNRNITIDNFVDIFLEEYVPHISKNNLKKMSCYPPDHGYLWMICENNLINYYSGKEAMNLYDEINKLDAIEFQYDNGYIGDKTAIPLSSNNMSSSLIASSGLYEFYVIGKDFSWCYIVTHEANGCGPYLIIKDNLKLVE